MDIRSLPFPSLVLFIADSEKTTNLIINLEEDPELFPKSDEQTLADWGLGALVVSK